MNPPGGIRQTNNIAKITKVINAAFITVAAEFGFTSDNAPTFPAFISPDVIERQLKSGLIMFGYYEREVLQGCVGIKNMNENDVWLIERLAVLPECRHKNIGKMLMEYAIRRIRERKGKTAAVEIVHENEVLREWYVSLGFTEIRVDTYPHLPFTVGVLTQKLD